ncbi:tRNA lysidine(34) synthetase TilS [Gordonia sp. PDNC005]|uniref:tRNA lysidine(34) synthetase TilS n=1 Tax=Gordonia sp. PDNC005 TaxID=2811424 RepID=UPI0019630BF9|nr:tRNA lysidine(34) synthetase TilS [Gordonia sp. PDNC005]QRY64754.1 tRNA lysidine(34) synthetase TilS [Gordonia sp. PDNC005]
MTGTAERAVIGAVRGYVSAHLDGGPVCVALSGGADSLALTAGAVRAGLDVHAIVVDHGLQDGSDVVAETAAATVRRLGATAEVRRVTVDGAGGLEAAARTARYTALDMARSDRPVLLGHTLDDQAETVLLGLGRGSGGRSLAGMRPWSAPWGRPLLGIRRTQTVAACEGWGLPVWDDPHNSDPRFTRVRVRTEVLPLLEDVLASGVAEALARTADQLTADSDALDALAGDVLDRQTDEGLAVIEVAGAPSAIRTRAVRFWLQRRGIEAPSHRQVTAVDALVSDWHGQGPIAVGGDDEARLVVTRRAGVLVVERLNR